MVEHELFEGSSVHYNSDGGFSMIEMLIAIVVILVGLVSIVGVSAYVSRANSASSRLNVFVAAAQDQVDRLRTAVWNRTVEDPTVAVGGSLTESLSVPSAQSSTPSSGPPAAASVTQAQPYTYTLDADNHGAVVSNTPAGNLSIRWVIRAGPTPDVRHVTIRIIQSGVPTKPEDALEVTTIISRS